MTDPIAEPTEPTEPTEPGHALTESEQHWFEEEIGRLKSALTATASGDQAPMPATSGTRAQRLLDEQGHAGVGVEAVAVRLARVERRLDDIQARLQAIEIHPPAPDRPHTADRDPLAVGGPQARDELERG